MKIVLIDIDTLRPDRLGCYGSKVNTSPNMDRLAKEGAIFTRAYTSNSPCVPARAAMIPSSTRPRQRFMMRTLPGVRAMAETRATVVAPFMRFAALASAARLELWTTAAALPSGPATQ